MEMRQEESGDMQPELTTEFRLLQQTMFSLQQSVEKLSAQMEKSDVKHDNDYRSLDRTMNNFERALGNVYTKSETFSQKELELGFGARLNRLEEQSNRVLTAYAPLAISVLSFLVVFYSVFLKKP